MTPSSREALIRAVLETGRELGAANQAFHATVSSRLGLGPSDIKALDLLRADGPLTPKQLGAELGLAPASVTGLLDRLESQGMIGRQRHPEDGRQVLVRADPDAVRRVAPLFAGLEKELRAMMRGRDDAELQAIAALLAELAARLRAASVD